MRRITKILLFIAAAFVIVATAATSTHLGQSSMLRLVASIASSEDSAIAIGELNGSLFDEASIAEISVSDKDGPWLTVRNISFAWSPSELFSGRAAISYLHVDKIAVLRKPVGAPKKTNTDKSSPGLPLKIALRELDVKAIDISEQVTGEHATLRLTGGADVGDTKKANVAQFHLERIDGPQSDLRANVSYNPEMRALELAISGSESENGLVSHLLGFPSRPPLSVELHGSGALNAWKANLSLAANSEPFLAGTLRLDETNTTTHRLSGSLAGFVERLVPAAAADILAGKTELNVSADITGLNDGALRSISDIRVNATGASMQVAATGGIDIASGYVHGGIEGHARRNDGEPLTFPIEKDNPVSVREISFRATLPDTNTARRSTATVRLNGIDNQKFAAETLLLEATASQPDPAGQRASVFDDIRLTLSASGVDETKALGKSVGPSPRLAFSGTYDGSRLTIAKADVESAGAVGSLAGIIEGGRINGTARLNVSDASRYDAIADRPLKGRMTLGIKFDGDLTAQTIAAAVSGESTGLATGVEALDGVLAPATKFSAVIERTADGALSTRDTSISNELFAATLKAKRAQNSRNASGSVTLSSLAAINPQLTGKAQLALDVSGSDADLVSHISLTGDGVTLNGKPVEEPSLSFTGRGPLSRHEGKFTANGTISGETLTGAAALMLSDTGAISISDLDLDIAGTKLGGNLALGGAAPPSGTLKIHAPNLARLGNAIGTKLKGRIAADVALTGDKANSIAKLNITADDILVGDLRIGSIRSTGNVANYLEFPDGVISAKIAGIANGKKALGGLSLDARFKDGGATLTSKGQIDGGALELSATSRTVENIQQIEIKSASYTGKSGLPPIRLASPARLSVKGETVSIPNLKLAIGTGSFLVNGSANSNALDLGLNLELVPASLASIAAPELGVEGSISGTAKIKGNPSNPEIAATISATTLSLQETHTKQLPAADVTIDIAAKDSKAQVKMRATARGGTDLAVNGTVGMKNGSALALSGRGSIPLALANVFLADRAARAGGTAMVTADISGKLSDPRVDGSILVDGATLSDPGLGLELSPIAADIGFSQDKVTVRKLVATSKKGGSVNAEGALLLPKVGEPSADVAIRIAAFKFGNQDPVAGEIDGNVKVAGPLNALVANGNVLIGRMDVTVPNKMPKSVSALDIRHVNAPEKFQSPEREKEKSNAASSSGSTISLALDVRANDRIFVRGRGVDAQLGGFVKIRGSADNPFTDGQFTTSRGKLSIIGRQLDFSRGNVVFMGSLEPSLDMEAQADADGTTVTIRVTGPASNPKFRFTSSPELPEDEIVSLLLFNKKLAKLSAAQLVQLASEIDKIGGLSSGPGTLDKMKSAMGIDVLDVTTDEKGNAQASAGSYIDDKTYVGVKQGMSLGKSRIVVDHNLTKNLKARGEAGTDGDSKLGLGFEWDY
ncbi:hypothetical protein DLM45_10980 [Hyphomicrobium methylovorum]|uniref:translocation/assembly module TamB domain-containing protein n=1 Tax=Hyphomicrobium methylovorum TaxID=84 RepID=UPI0015E7B26D|nr:translocation/assembly module TamB domain-containing protein [Hyphomicrobium methylovorum]MBA2126735.1 hypothetical protein [Hyphomicrobium methylovorum]